MQPTDTTVSWKIIATASLREEVALIKTLIAEAGLDVATREKIAESGADLVRRIRASARPGLMEVFLAEYGLSTEEGVALMCLAEALLRVPDATMGCSMRWMAGKATPKAMNYGALSHPKPWAS